MNYYTSWAFKIVMAVGLVLMSHSLYEELTHECGVAKIAAYSMWILAVLLYVADVYLLKKKCRFNMAVIFLILISSIVHNL